MEKTALILIDIQNIYFTEGPMLLQEPKAAAEKAGKVLEWFRKKDMPVIHVKHIFEMKEYKQSMDYLNEIHDSVKPIASEQVVEKHHPSAFLETSLQECLSKMKVKNLVVVGMMSHMCVDTTVRACQDYGYDVTVIEDACTTMDLQWKGKKMDATTVHQTFMAAINRSFAEVVSLKEFIPEC
ncbi:MAG TPA: cysteine hydrolase family protein [Lachnospiraceae bacterium]|nr:cysteine hydrolase family protein [Lachnospiraceae bacterium]